MKSSKHLICKWRIVSVILAAWICFDSIVIVTTAQEPPSLPHKRELIGPYTHTADIGESLIEIAERVSRQSANQMIDIMFVIDGSLPMERSVREVERQIVQMIGIFESNLIIDYQIGLVWFQKIKSRSLITIKPFEKLLPAIEHNFLYIVPRKKFWGKLAGYGLDGIIKGLNQLQFRSGADKLLIVVTNSPLTTTRERESAIEMIIDRCDLDKIRINCIGIDEDLQRYLAIRTGGKWYPIGTDQRNAIVTPDMLDIDLTEFLVSRIDEMFKGIAQHISETVRQPADIVFIYDSSLSMVSKMDDILTGLNTFVTILDSEGLDYRLGVIRFWAPAGGGASTITISQPPLSVHQVKELFLKPKRGTEHLLDAIMEGVRKLRTPDNRKLVIFIITDEPSSRGPGKRYTPTTAIQVCRNADAQVNIIGASVNRPVKLYPVKDHFQPQVTEATNGRRYVLPETQEFRNTHLFR